MESNLILRTSAMLPAISAAGGATMAGMRLGGCATTSEPASGRRDQRVVSAS